MLMGVAKAHLNCRGVSYSFCGFRPAAASDSGAGLVSGNVTSPFSSRISRVPFSFTHLKGTDLRYRC
jgi:hypothetical protein